MAKQNMYVVVKVSSHPQRMQETKVVMFTWNREEAEQVVDGLNQLAVDFRASIIEVSKGQSLWL